jgi:hypothetical protein
MSIGDLKTSKKINAPLLVVRRFIRSWPKVYRPELKHDSSATHAAEGKWRQLHIISAEFCVESNVNPSKYGPSTDPRRNAAPTSKWVQPLISFQWRNRDGSQKELRIMRAEPSGFLLQSNTELNQVAGDREKALEAMASQMREIVTDNDARIFAPNCSPQMVLDVALALFDEGDYLSVNGELFYLSEGRLVSSEDESNVIEPDLPILTCISTWEKSLEIHRPLGEELYWERVITGYYITDDDQSTLYSYHIVQEKMFWIFELHTIKKPHIETYLAACPGTSISELALTKSVSDMDASRRIVAVLKANSGDVLVNIAKTIYQHVRNIGIGIDSRAAEVLSLL